MGFRLREGCGVEISMAVGGSFDSVNKPGETITAHRIRGKK